MEDNKKKNAIDKFLDKKPKQECEGEECLIDNKNGELIEKVSKKYVMSDGRQLLREITNESN